MRKQIDDIIAGCKTDLCVSNVSKNTSLQVPTDYIQTCLDRKLKGLPTFGY